jgi:predicted kinase
MMSKLIMMMGLPYSGKSTLVEMINDMYLTIIVSADRIRKTIHGQKYYQDCEDFVWGIRNIMLNELMKQKLFVIIDETNTTISRRKKIVNLCEKYNYKLFAIELLPAKDICIERARKNDDNDIIPVIERMSKQYQIIEDDLNYFEKVYQFDNSVLNNMQDIDKVMHEIIKKT